jgi:hypothetical protein
MLLPAMILSCLILALLCLVVGTDLPPAATVETEVAKQPVRRR